MFTIHNTEYKTIVFRDVKRDGMGMGLEIAAKNSDCVIPEIFRNDSVKKIELTAFKANLDVCVCD